MKATFEERLIKVKEKLPFRYGLILRHKHPELKFHDIYNTIHEKSKNEKILKALEKEFLK